MLKRLDNCITQFLTSLKLRKPTELDPSSKNMISRKGAGHPEKNYL